MKFNHLCPKCKVVLLPKEDNDKVFLVCGNCGYTKEEKNITEHKCSVCGCNKSIEDFYGITKGDEDPLTFYICVRCGNTDRHGWSY